MPTEGSKPQSDNNSVEEKASTKLTEKEIWQKILTKKQECVQIQRQILNVSTVVKKSKAIMSLKDTAKSLSSSSLSSVEQDTTPIVQQEVRKKLREEKSYTVSPEIYIESSSPIGNYIQHRTFCSPSYLSDFSGSSGVESPGDEQFRDTIAYYKAPLLLRPLASPSPTFNLVRPPLLPTPADQEEQSRNMRGSPGFHSSPRPRYDSPFDPSYPPQQTDRQQWSRQQPMGQQQHQQQVSRNGLRPSHFQMQHHHVQNFNTTLQQEQQQQSYNNNFHFHEPPPNSQYPDYSRPPSLPTPDFQQHHFQRQNQFYLPHHQQKQQQYHPHHHHQSRPPSPSIPVIRNRYEMPMAVPAPGPMNPIFPPRTVHSIPRFPRDNLHRPPSYQPRSGWRRKIMSERYPVPREIATTTTTTTTSADSCNIPIKNEKNYGGSVVPMGLPPSLKPMTTMNHHPTTSKGTYSKNKRSNNVVTSSKRSNKNVEENKIKTCYDLGLTTLEVRKPFDVYFHSPEFKAKTRCTTLIESILLGNRCHFCGNRYICNPEESKEYSEHLDIHFKENRSLKQINNMGIPLSQAWYLSEEDWISGVEAKQFVRLSGSQWKNVLQPSGIKRSSSIIDQRDDIKKIKSKCSVPVFEKNSDCPLCEEVLEAYFDEDFEEWRFKNSALSDDGRAFHVICLEEYKTSENNQ